MNSAMAQNSRLDTWGKTLNHIGQSGRGLEHCAPQWPYVWSLQGFSQWADIWGYKGEGQTSSVSVWGTSLYSRSLPWSRTGHARHERRLVLCSTFFAFALCCSNSSLSSAIESHQKCQRLGTEHVMVNILLQLEHEENVKNNLSL